MFNLKLEDHPSTEQYITEAMSIAQKLADIEKPVDDEFLAIVLLHGLPSTPKYESMKSRLQATHDVLSSEVVKTRLLQDVAGRVDERTGESVLVIGHKSHTQSSRGERKIICYNCNKEGHVKTNCPKFKKTRGRYNKDFKDTKKAKEVKEESSKSEDKGKNALLLTATTALLAKNFKTEDWYIDSGATAHMTHRDDWLKDPKITDTVEISVADNSVCKSEKSGQVNIILPDGNSRVASNVMHVPQLFTNLLSVSKMTEKGLTVVFDSKNCKVYNTAECTINGKVQVTATKISGLYRLDQQQPAAQVAMLSSMKLTSTEDILMAKSSNDFELWHRRLGHLHYKYMVILKNGLVSGVSFTDPQKEIWNCVSCLEGKQCRIPFKKNGTFQRATKKLELVHTDLCGPMSVSTFSGAPQIAQRHP